MKRHYFTFTFEVKYCNKSVLKNEYSSRELQYKYTKNQLIGAYNVREKDELQQSTCTATAVIRTCLYQCGAY